MSRVTFKNEADCTNKLSQEVTVFQRFMHMHEVGTHMRTRHYRQNSLLREDIVDFYDFKQAGGVAPRSTGNGFKIKPGDRFEVECNYQVSESPRVFGLGSRDEMCMDFVYYYPAKETDPKECYPTYPVVTVGQKKLLSPEIKVLTTIDRVFADKEPATCSTSNSPTSNSPTPMPTPTPTPSPASRSTASVFGCCVMALVSVCIINTGLYLK